MPVAEVVITYEELLQSEQILVRSKALSDEQLRCLSRLQREKPYPILMLETDDLTRRSYELERQNDRLEAREWLRVRGLLDSLPSYDPKAESISHFARRIETFCGIKPGSMLMLYSPKFLTIRPQWAEQSLRQEPTASEDEKVWCLMNAISASDLAQHGFSFGFVGNEVYSPASPEK